MSIEPSKDTTNQNIRLEDVEKMGDASNYFV